MAQTFDPKSVDQAMSKSELRIGVRYTSDFFYMGRSDSAAAPYLSPSVGYFHKSGFFARTSLSYLTSSGEERVDLILLSGGYDYFGKKFGGGVSVSEYFFNDLSYTVQSEMTTYLNAYAGYSLLGFMVYVDGSIGFSEGTDLFTGGEISRTFNAVRSKLKITPGVYINAGTQKYYDAFYTNRSVATGPGPGNGKGHGKQQPSVTQQLLIVESDSFQLLDYEADLQVSYKIGKIKLYILGTWIFPLNPATVISDNGVYQEDLDNGFFWSTGVRVSF